MYDIGIENGLLYMEGRFVPLNLYTHGDKLAIISSDHFACRKTIDASGKHILPGFIDPHVHFHLGVGENISADDFYSGSLEAVAGGVTTIIDFLDPVKSASEIQPEFEKRQALARECVTDYGFHCTIADPKDQPSWIVAVARTLGIPSIKLFTTYSESDRRTYDDYILHLLEESARSDSLVMVHAENDRLIDKSKNISVASHEESRPAIAENIEVLKLAQMTRQTGGHLYIVHVSAGSTVSMLTESFEKELLTGKIILESCPHYFLLNCELLKNEDGYKYTMTPPVREENERQLLGGLIDEISVIATDHCPYKMEQKNHKYTSEIPMGIGGLRYSFLNMYTEYGFAIVDKFTKEPAQIHRLANKGVLLPGYDADIVIFDTAKDSKIDDPDSVYYGQIKKGRIDTVIAGGDIVIEDGTLAETMRKGKYINRVAPN